MGRARGLEEHGWETQGIQDSLRISQGTCTRSGVGSSSSLPCSSAVTGAAQMLLQCRRQPLVETGAGSQQHFAGRSNPRKYQASFRNTKMSSLAASLWQGSRQGLCSAPCIPPPPPTPNIRAPPKDSILLERPHVFHSNELQPSCTKMRVAQSTLPRFITPIM